MALTEAIWVKFTPSVERSIRKPVALLALLVQLISISLPEMTVPVRLDGAAGSVVAVGL